MWSAAKGYFQKRLLANQEELNQSAFERLVLESFAQLGPEKLANLTGSNRAYIESMLRAGV